LLKYSAKKREIIDEIIVPEANLVTSCTYGGPNFDSTGYKKLISIEVVKPGAELFFE